MVENEWNEWNDSIYLKEFKMHNQIIYKIFM